MSHWKQKLCTVWPIPCRTCCPPAIIFLYSAVRKEVISVLWEKVIGLLGTIDLDWHEDLNSFWDKLNLINFNPQLTYLDCLFTMDASDLWWLTALLPVLNVSIRLLEYWLSTIANHFWHRVTHRNTDQANSMGLMEALKPSPVLKAGILRQVYCSAKINSLFLSPCIVMTQHK